MLDEELVRIGGQAHTTGEAVAVPMVREEFVAVFPGIRRPAPPLERLGLAIEALDLPHASP